MRKDVFEISAGFYLGLSLVILIFPLKWVLAWMLSALVHELSHYFALKCLHVEVYRIKLGLNGAIMDTGPMCKKATLIATTAGPLGGILLLLLYPVSREIFYCALIQSIYNLLPIYPLDGGRILNILFSCFFSESKTVLAMKIIGLVNTVALCAGGLYLGLRSGCGFLPVLLVIALSIKMAGKITCKERKQIVQ